MKKRVFGILLVIVMVVGMVPEKAFGSDFEHGEDDLSVILDMPDDWSTKALENAINNGLLSGYDGKILPKSNLTRAQMAAVINRAFGSIEAASLNSYKDVDEKDWYYSDMAKAVQMRTFLGSDNQLNPKSPITREEAFLVLVRAFKLSNGNRDVLDTFSDKASVSTWAEDAAASLVASGYIAGSNGKLNPKAKITRAEFAQLMDNMVKQYIKEAGTYTEDVHGNVMVNTADAILKDMRITGDLIIGDGVGEGDVILDSTVVTGRMVIRGGGQHSIKIIGNSDLKNITIARVKGKVRVYTEDRVEVGETIVDGNDDVIIQGSMGTVKVTASDVTVTATSAKIESGIVEGDHSKIIVSENSEIEKAEIKGAQAEIIVEKGSEIKDITVNGKDAEISGDGEVDTVQAKADGVTVSTPGAKVTASNGAKDIKAGRKLVDEGNTEIVPSKSSGKSHSSSSSSNSKSATLPLVSYTPVTLTQKVDVTNGQLKYQDTAAVFEALPTEIAVTLEDDSSVSIPVTWADTDSYNTSAPGIYTFTAEWGEMSEGANNNNSLTAPTVEVVVPTPVEYFNFDASGKDLTIIGYDTAGGTDVVIPSIITLEADEYIVKHIGDNAFTGSGGIRRISVMSKGGEPSAQLTSVYIPNSVISIGNASFSRQQLSAITIPDSITNIGERAFSRNPLTEVYIPKSVTHIGNQAFYDCTQLKRFTVDGDNDHFSSLEGVLFSKDQTTLIRFPYDKAGDYSIPEGVKQIAESAFWGCVKLTQMHLPDSIKSIGNNAFANCSSLTDINFPNGITRVEYGTFAYCTALTDISLPGDVTYVGNSAFRNCRGLVSIDMSDNVEYIGDRGFINCEALNNITLSDRVTYIGSYAFSNTGLVDITIPNSVTRIASNSFSYSEKLKGISIPNSVTSIGSGAFAYCSGLTSIIIPNSVTSIERSAFSNCTAVSEIAISENVTAIDDYTFFRCESLDQITIPNSVTSIGYASFLDCTALNNVIIGSDVTMGNRAFIDSTKTINFLTAYEEGNAGTYTRSGDNWTKVDGDVRTTGAIQVEVVLTNDLVGKDTHLYKIVSNDSKWYPLILN